jgi:hypothetical protein
MFPYELVNNWHVHLFWHQLVTMINDYKIRAHVLNDEKTSQLIIFNRNILPEYNISII